uniref:Uncharacterized protein n=1 Tax=Populus davidiana TaxID=266767 RepID=A0A6M2F7F8_9ROSI
MIPTLSQWLGSFPTESRAKRFPQYRQDFPLPPPINRGGFHGLKGGENRVQTQQKTSFFFRFLHIYFFLSLRLFHSCLLRREYQHTRPTHHQKYKLHHRKSAQPPSSHRDSLSLFCRPVSSSFFSATATSTVAAEAATTSYRGFNPLKQHQRW